MTSAKGTSDQTHEPGLAAWSAVLLAGVALLLVALGVAGFGGAGGGMAAALIAFILAVVAWRRKVRWVALWLPLGLLPVLLLTSPFWV
jgi:hypothetical protein